MNEDDNPALRPTTITIIDRRENVPLPLPEFHVKRDDSDGNDSENGDTPVRSSGGDEAGDNGPRGEDPGELEPSGDSAEVEGGARTPDFWPAPDGEEDPPPSAGGD